MNQECQANSSANINDPLAMGAFAQSSHFVINNSTLIDASNRDRQGISILRRHVAFSASHDAERFPKPNCSADTRTRILGEIMDWINDPKPSHHILWLCGPAGAGKSAIAQTVAETAEKVGRLGASFFFSRGASGRGTADQLFTTIAYQLAQNVPEVKNHISYILESKPELPTKSLDVQFRELIATPVGLAQCGSSFYIGIDGVDECNDENAQESILKVIGEALRTSDFPLRFMISSRPEPHIRWLFENDYRTLTRFVVLETTRETLRDVEKHLLSGFADIYKRYQRAMIHVPQPWPPRHVVDTLCARSSGHFIYAATVLKFVGEKTSHPVKQLAIILQPSLAPRSTSPFSDLDNLYLQVLSTHPRRSELLDILGYFLVIEERHPALLDDLLDFEPGTVVMSLNGLHSLMKISDADCFSRPSTFHHASFYEFLVDAKRSGDFYIDLERYRLEVLNSCVRLLVRCLDEVSRSNYPEANLPPFGLFMQPESRYFFSTLAFFHECRGDIDDTLGHIFKLFARLWSPISNNHDIHSIFIGLEQSIYNKRKETSRLMYLITHTLVTDNVLKLWGDMALYTLSVQLQWPLAMLYQTYDDYLRSESSSALRSLLELQGILALKRPLAVTTLAECFCIDLSTLIKLIEQSLPFFVFQTESFAVMVVPSLVKFLTNASRSELHYQDYQKHEAVLLHRCLQYIPDKVDSGMVLDLVIQVDDISISTLENNIDTFIPCLRKFIRQDSNKCHAFEHMVKIILEQIDRKFSYNNKLHLTAIARICEEISFSSDDSPMLPRT